MAYMRCSISQQMYDESMGMDKGKNEPSYEIVNKVDDQLCHFRFPGKFAGQDIIWDAELVTLACYSGQSGQNKLQQFIDVGEVNDNGRKIIIALNLPCIDEPAILKTIIMIRQYKRLTFGRHEYGGIISFE